MPAQQGSQQPSAASTRKPKPKAKRGGGVETVQRENKSNDQLPSTGGTLSKKRKIATPQSNGSANAYSLGSANAPKTSVTIPTLDDSVTNNADFAREMAVARTGTQFTGQGNSNMSKKERRAQKQDRLRPGNGTESPSLSTGASSTTGADADDDLSPVASPALPATSNAATSKSGDVSDMLETPSAGPSVLRLTDPVNPAPQARVKQINKTFEPAETKKQRQQRMKREAHRAQAEEAEKERRKLMEKQIRGARMAEGTSAQTRTSAFKPPAENAWFSGSARRSTEPVKVSESGTPALLDTFEPTSQSVSPATTGDSHTVPPGPVTNWSASTYEERVSKDVSNNSAGKGRAEPLAASGKNNNDWATDLPIEAEQMRLIQDSEDSWTTVSKRDKKKASKLTLGQENDSSDVSIAEKHPANGLAPKSSASSRLAGMSGSNSYHHLGDSGFQDSDWVA